MAHIFTPEQLKERLDTSIMQNKAQLVAREWIPQSSATDRGLQLYIEKVRRYSGKAVITRHKPDDYNLNNSYDEEKSYKPLWITTGFSENKETIDKNPEMATEAITTSIQENTRTVLETDEFNLLYGNEGIEQEGLLNATGINIQIILDDGTGNITHVDKTAEDIIKDIDHGYNKIMRKIPGIIPNILALDTQLASEYRVKYFTNNATGELKETVYDAIVRKYSGMGVQIKEHASFADSLGNATYGFFDSKLQNFEIKNLEGLIVKEDEFKETETTAFWRFSEKYYLKLRKPWSIMIAEGTTELQSYALDRTDY